MLSVGTQKKMPHIVYLIDQFPFEFQHEFSQH